MDNKPDSLELVNGLAQRSGASGGGSAAFTSNKHLKPQQLCIHHCRNQQTSFALPKNPPGLAKSHFICRIEGDLAQARR